MGWGHGAVTPGGWTTFAMPAACGPGWRRDHPRAAVGGLGSLCGSRRLPPPAPWALLQGSSLTALLFSGIFAWVVRFLPSTLRGRFAVQLHALPTRVTPAPASVGDEGPVCASGGCTWIPDLFGSGGSHFRFCSCPSLSPPLQALGSVWVGAFVRGSQVRLLFPSTLSLSFRVLLPFSRSVAVPRCVLPVVNPRGPFPSHGGPWLVLGLLSPLCHL